MKKIIFYSLPAFFLLLGYFGFIKNKSLQSAPPTSVKDVLSSSQLSYFARLAVGTSAGDTQLRVALSGNPSNTTRNLFVGDTIGIGISGPNGGLTKYIVGDIGNTATFQITSGIGTSNNLASTAIVATRSAQHTVYFTPKSSVMGGVWQFLIKATSRTGEAQQDGIPDQQGFDLGQDVGSTNTGLGTRLKAADIICPFGTASVGTTVIINSNSYHVIACTLGAGATNAVDVGVTMVIGRDLSTGSQLINPSAAEGHTEGQASSTAADVYTFYIRHLDASSVVIDADTATGKVAVVEAVRVTATVDPTITFSIGTTAATGVGGTACGNTAFGANAANTDATSASFGSLTLGAFNNLAHYLTTVTNADGGYVVTVYENSQMKNISTGTSIADTNCDGACSSTTAAAWATDNSNSEWGYTMQNINVGTTIFNYQSGYKAFGVGPANAKEIMKNTTTPTATERAYICYRLTASTTQEAGNYEAKLIYTATATF